jgi:hypothetical protein
MMSGCYIYHKCQHIKAKNAPSLLVIPQKTNRRLKKFLRKPSTSSSAERKAEDRRMRAEARDNFDTPASTPGDYIDKVFAETEEEDKTASQHSYTIHL